MVGVAVSEGVDAGVGVGTGVFTGVAGCDTHPERTTMLPRTSNADKRITGRLYIKILENIRV
jgi:hypothetical protein